MMIKVHTPYEYDYKTHNSVSRILIVNATYILAIEEGQEYTKLYTTGGNYFLCCESPKEIVEQINKSMFLEIKF